MAAGAFLLHPVWVQGGVAPLRPDHVFVEPFTAGSGPRPSAICFALQEIVRQLASDNEHIASPAEDPAAKLSIGGAVSDDGNQLFLDAGFSSYDREGRKQTSTRRLRVDLPGLSAFRQSFLEAWGSPKGRTPAPEGLAAGALEELGSAMRLAALARYDESGRLLAELLSAHPHSGILLTAQGWVQYRAKDAGAMETFQKALEADPWNTDAWDGCLLACARTHDAAKVRDLLQLAGGGPNRAAAKAADRLLELAQEDLPDRLELAGQLKDAGGSRHEAIALLAAASRVYGFNQDEFASGLRAGRAALTLADASSDHEKDGEIQAFLGLCQSVLGDYAGALKSTDEAWDIGVRSGDVYVQGLASLLKGAALYTIRSYREAIPFFERAQQAFHKVGQLDMEGNALDGQGFCYRNLNENLKALTLLERALECQQKGSQWTPWVLNEIGRAHV